MDFNKLFSYFKFTRFQTLNYRYKFFHNIFIKRKNKKYIEPYKFLNKYSYSINNVLDKSTENNDDEMPIWQCWLQGTNNMPDLVKICMQSVKKFNPNRKIIILTEENIKDYIKLPDYIIEKYKKGIIPKPQFSDILRLSILKEYGGVWIDATIYLTGKLPEGIFSSDFFTLTLLADI